MTPVSAFATKPSFKLLFIVLLVTRVAIVPLLSVFRTTLVEFPSSVLVSI